MDRKTNNQKQQYYTIKNEIKRLKKVVSEHNKKRTYYVPQTKINTALSFSSLRNSIKKQRQSELPLVIKKNNERFSKLLRGRKSSLHSSRLKINSRYLSPKENIEFVTKQSLNSSRSSTQSYYRKQIYSQKNLNVFKRGSLFTPQNRSKQGSLNSSFIEINHKLEELNKSIDESINSSKRRSNQYGISGILRPKKSLVQLKEKSKTRRQPIRRESSVIDLPEETKKKLLKIYKENKSNSKRNNDKIFQVALKKIISSNGNQKYLDIFKLSDIESVKCLNQSLSATSRNLLVDAGEKNAINAKAIQRFQRRLGILAVNPASALDVNSHKIKEYDLKQYTSRQGRRATLKV